MLQRCRKVADSTLAGMQVILMTLEPNGQTSTGTLSASGWEESCIYGNPTVARVLNVMKYGEYSNRNMIWLCFRMLFCRKFARCVLIKTY